METQPAPKKGKPKGRHPENRLTATAVKKAKAGRHADGNGLFLEVDKSGARRWMLRVVANGRRRDLGLGGASYVGLAEARALAEKLRKVAREGGDPKAERDRDRREAITFKDAAERVYAEQVVPIAKPGRHVREWLASLERIAFDQIGALPVHLIGEAEVMKVLAPVWTEKPETARRVRRRMAQVLEWARAAGHREGPNPVDFVKGGAGLPKHRDEVRHFTALPFDDLPALWPKLADAEGMGAAALRFAVLCAARSGEVRGATWAEINLEARTWVIPKERMKAGKAHSVPLSDEAIAELQKVKPLAEGKGDAAIIFPSRMGKPVSDMTLAAVLKRLKVPVTVHGFRSTFRDWAEERARARYEVAEAALAHRPENKVERAYRRSDLFDQRRDLMNQWARFATGGTADVVQLRA
ncbi:MAG: integrase arm-type DNA-binding domain-containing protein [Pseudomonadota bacterium]